jgi:hypothetical protein
MFLSSRSSRQLFRTIILRGTARRIPDLDWIDRMMIKNNNLEVNNCLRRVSNIVYCTYECKLSASFMFLSSLSSQIAQLSHNIHIDRASNHDTLKEPVVGGGTLVGILPSDLYPCLLSFLAIIKVSCSGAKTRTPSFYYKYNNNKYKYVLVSGAGYQARLQ